MSSVSKVTRNRYSGSLRITIALMPDGTYTGLFFHRGTRTPVSNGWLAISGVQLSVHDASRIALDSKKAFDRIAPALVNFAEHVYRTDVLSQLAEHDARGELVIRSR